MKSVPMKSNYPAIEPCAEPRRPLGSVKLLNQLVLGCFLFIPVLNATSLAAAETNEFLVRTYAGKGNRPLPYRLLLPKRYDPKTSYPIILYLHGAAARGKDNVEPLNWG